MTKSLKTLLTIHKRELNSYHSLINKFCKIEDYSYFFYYSIFNEPSINIRKNTKLENLEKVKLEVEAETEDIKNKIKTFEQLIDLLEVINLYIDDLPKRQFIIDTLGTNCPEAFVQQHYILKSQILPKLPKNIKTVSYELKELLKDEFFIKMITRIKNNGFYTRYETKEDLIKYLKEEYPDHKF